MTLSFFITVIPGHDKPQPPAAYSNPCISVRECAECYLHGTAAAADGVTFSVPVTPHTFRHSYAMHMLYAGIPLKVLQSLMGHESISSTEVYTKVFALDVAARHRVQFSMPGPMRCLCSKEFHKL